MDVRATITVSDARALPSLAAALDGGSCAVDAWAPDSLDVAFDWGEPADDELAHAWSEVVFFLTTWQGRHPTVSIDLADVHFAPADGTETT